jgi:hypothetical protein
MAKLNKQQQAEFDALRQALAVALAWRRTEKVERDVPPPEGVGLTRGWDARAWNGQYRVDKACSSSVSHGDGWERTTSQGAHSLYSTRERALRAVRYQIEQQCAETLAKIDAEIAKELAEAVPTPERPPLADFADALRNMVLDMDRRGAHSQAKRVAEELLDKYDGRADS